MSRSKMIIVEKFFLDSKWNVKNTISILDTKRLLRHLLADANLEFKNIHLSCEYIDDAQMQGLNFFHRGINKPTDVLSFEMCEKSKDFIALELYLAYETICKQSKKYNIPFKERLLHLYLHGLLHCFGFDHVKDCDRVEMEAIEKRILAKFNVVPY